MCKQINSIYIASILVVMAILFTRCTSDKQKTLDRLYIELDSLQNQQKRYTSKKDFFDSLSSPFLDTMTRITELQSEEAKKALESARIGVLGKFSHNDSLVERHRYYDSIYSYYTNQSKQIGDSSEFIYSPKIKIVKDSIMLLK